MHRLVSRWLCYAGGAACEARLKRSTAAASQVTGTLENTSVPRRFPQLMPDLIRHGPRPYVAQDMSPTGHQPSGSTSRYVICIGLLVTGTSCWLACPSWFHAYGCCTSLQPALS